MRVALRELVRRPGRFLVVGGALTVLVLLLLFLGGLLDGLYLNSTGAVRSLDADGIVFSNDARQSFLRSTITPELRDTIESVDGVAETGGLGFALLGVTVPGESDVADGAVIGYELSSDSLPAPPEPGKAYADSQLRDDGVAVGDRVLVGPAEVPLEVVGFVDDTNYLQQGGLWVEPGTWRSVLSANRPDAVVGDGEFQALVVRVAAGADVPRVLDAIDQATGSTETLTEAEAIDAIPGVTEQSSTFTAVIGVTVFVAGLVIALFFALLTLERLGLYAVLKTFGGSSASARRRRRGAGRGRGGRRLRRRWPPHPRSAPGGARRHPPAARTVPGRHHPRQRHHRLRVRRAGVAAPHRPHRPRHRHRCRSLRRSPRARPAHVRRPQDLPLRRRRGRGPRPRQPGGRP